MARRPRSSNFGGRRLQIPLPGVARLPFILNALPGSFRTVTNRAFASRNLTPDDVAIETAANGPLTDLFKAAEGFAIPPFSLARTNSAFLVTSRIIEPVMASAFPLAIAGGQPVSAVWREAARLVRLVVRVEPRHGRWAVRPRLSLPEVEGTAALLQ